jgi:hypothetical protein
VETTVSGAAGHTSDHTSNGSSQDTLEPWAWALVAAVVVISVSVAVVAVSRSNGARKRLASESTDGGSQDGNGDDDYDSDVDCEKNKQSFGCVESSNGMSTQSSLTSTTTPTKHGKPSMWPDLRDHESLSGSVVDLTFRVQSPTHRALYGTHRNSTGSGGRSIVSIDDEVEVDDESADDRDDLYATPIRSVKLGGMAWESTL